MKKLQSAMCDVLFGIMSITLSEHWQVDSANVYSITAMPDYELLIDRQTRALIDWLLMD